MPAGAFLPVAPIPCRLMRRGRLRKSGLFQVVADLIEPGASASIVQIAAGRTGCTDRANDFVVDLDHETAANKEQIRQLCQQRGDRDGLRSLDQRTRVGLERSSGVSLVERVITAQDCLTYAIDVD